MMKTVSRKLTVTFIAAQLISVCGAYEINNHADMSLQAALLSKLTREGGANGKLSRLGLRALDIENKRQLFPLVPITGVLPEIRYCFGEYLPGGTARDYEASSAGRLQDSAVEQPDWSGRKFTIAQLIRYGGCFEDSESPFSRPLSHFYNPQNSGAGLAVPSGTPNSLAWSLRRNEGNSLTGSNHYNWEDARQSFYQALTLPTATQRANAWGTTFQALGHVMHHLQDMASPQHVRDDPHCNAPACFAAIQIGRAHV